VESREKLTVLVQVLHQLRVLMRILAPRALRHGILEGPVGRRIGACKAHASRKVLGRLGTAGAADFLHALSRAIILQESQVSFKMSAEGIGKNLTLNSTAPLQ
jgi:hypothetical protein